MSFSRSEWLRREDEESDDEEVETGQLHDRPDAICYLVEVSPSMLDATEFEDDQGNTRYRSNLSTALRSALDLMRTRIISGSPRDVVGVVLYDTILSKNVDDEQPKEGLYLVLEPSSIRAANIKMMSDLIEDMESSPEAAFKRFNPRDKEIKQTTFIEGMRFSENLLKNRSSVTANRQLHIITDNDDPFQGNKQQQSVACVFSNDAHEAGFQIKTLFMPEDADKFKLERFWNRFRFDPSLDADMDNAALVFSGPERFQKLLSLSSEAGKTRRAQFSVPFFVYEGIAMSVTGYGAVNEQRKKAPVQVEQAEEIREIYYKTTYAETETGETIDPKKDIIKYMSIGTKDQNEQRVFFENDEIVKIKNLGMSPSLKLLGFLPRSQMKPQHTNRHSYLIYPNETLYLNSIPAFSALLKSMLKKGVVGLGVLVARVNSTPQLVYMLPQAEVRDEQTDNQVDPPCIWLVQIPFADDIRPPTTEVCLSTLPESGVAADDNGGRNMVQLFTKLLKKLRVVYLPNQFANPVLQYHYANLEALALSLDAPEAIDQTLPQTEAIAERVGAVVKDIKAALEQHPKLDDSSWLSVGAGANGDDGSDAGNDGPSASKKVKVSKERAVKDISTLERSLVKALQDKNLRGITVDFLKDYLKQKNVKSTNNKKKGELLEMAQAQLEKDGKL